MSERSGAENWYEVLGVSPEASDAEVGQAFRRLARQFHPDVAEGRDTASDERFDEISRAYQVLGDPARRATYDRTRVGPPRFADGTQRIPVRNGASVPRASRRPARSEPTRGDEAPTSIEIELSFREALLGATRQVSIPVTATCSGCRGARFVSGGPCLVCKGTGRVNRSSGSIAIHHVCDRCGGRGRLTDEPCARCGGSGMERSTRTLSVRVPAGIRDSARLRIPASRSASGGPHLVTVRVAEDQAFRREGNTVLVSLPLTLAEAALGAAVTLPSPSGATFTLVVPPGSASGQRLAAEDPKLPPSVHLVAVVEIVVPSELSKEQRAALEAFARVTPSPRAQA